MTSLFDERSDTESREPSVPIMGALNWKKYYTNMQGWYLVLAVHVKHYLKSLSKKHCLEGKATKNYLLCIINHNFLDD